MEINSLPDYDVEVKICYIVWSLGLGGAEQIVLHLASGLNRNHFQPIICCLNEPGPFANQATQAGIKVIPLHKRGPFDIFILLRLIKLFKKHKIDVVHTQLWGANLWGRLAALLARVPVIIATEQNLDPWKRWYNFFCDRILARKTTHLIAVSQKVQEFYESHNIGPGNWQVIHNSVATDEALPRGRNVKYHELGIKDDEPVVGLLGRLVPAKAPTVFLKAFEESLTKVPKLKALIIGDGPLRQDLHKFVSDHHLETQVVFAGLRHDVPELLSGMDVLVFSSEREGLSLAMVEAMSAGVPIIATRVGGTPELIESERTGFLVEPRDSSAIALHLVDILKNPEKAEKIRQAARNHVLENFSIKKLVDQHQVLYQQAMKKRIVMVIDHLDFGGAQQQLTSLVKSLSKKQIHIHVIALSQIQTVYADQIRSSGATLSLIDHHGKFSLKTLWSIYKTLRKTRPHIIHTWLFTAGLYGRIAAWLARVPTIICGIRSIDPDKSKSYILTDKFLRYLTDAFTINVNILRETLITREGIAPAKIHTIYNGVDLNSFTPETVKENIREELKISDTVPLVGIIGRLVPVKDHSTFLKAAAIVLEEFKDAIFLIVGNGSLLKTIITQTKQLGISSNVQFLESRHQIAAILNALDLVVVSSRSEACCNVILEGMAMAKPVIATSVGGNPELIVPNQTGLLVPPGDPESMARAVIQLLNDPGQRKAFGKEGRNRILKQFSLEQMTSKSTKLYTLLQN